MESVNSPTGSASLPFFCGTTSPKTKNPKRLKAVWDFVSEFSLAEGEGFEPSVHYWTRRLSRAVHSTCLQPFQDGFAFELGSGFLVAEREAVFPATGCA